MAGRLPPPPPRRPSGGARSRNSPTRRPRTYPAPSRTDAADRRPRFPRQRAARTAGAPATAAAATASATGATLWGRHGKRPRPRRRWRVGDGGGGGGGAGVAAAADAAAAAARARAGDALSASVSVCRRRLRRRRLLPSWGTPRSVPPTGGRWPPPLCAPAVGGRVEGRGRHDRRHRGRGAEPPRRTRGLGVTGERRRPRGGRRRWGGEWPLPRNARGLRRWRRREDWGAARARRWAPRCRW